MYISITNVLKELSSVREIENINIDFNIVYPMKDSNSNVSDDIVIKATFNHDSRNKINWDNFSWENIPTTADEWWIHTALKNALAE